MNNKDLSVSPKVDRASLKRVIRRQINKEILLTPKNTDKKFLGLKYNVQQKQTKNVPPTKNINLANLKKIVRKKYNDDNIENIVLAPQKVNKKYWKQEKSETQTQKKWVIDDTDNVISIFPHSTAGVVIRFCASRLSIPHKAFEVCAIKHSVDGTDYGKFNKRTGLNYGFWYCVSNIHEPYKKYRKIELDILHIIELPLSEYININENHLYSYDAFVAYYDDEIFPSPRLGSYISTSTPLQTPTSPLLSVLDHTTVQKNSKYQNSYQYYEDYELDNDSSNTDDSYEQFYRDYVLQKITETYYEEIYENTNEISIENYEFSAVEVTEESSEEDEGIFDDGKHFFKI